MMSTGALPILELGGNCQIVPEKRLRRQKIIHYISTHYGPFYSSCGFSQGCCAFKESGLGGNSSTRELQKNQISI